MPAQENVERSETERELQGAFVISRTFAAPRDLVFRAWTERDQLLQWWGPKGMKVIACTNDLRPGGVMHYGLQAANGAEMWGRWTYREVTPPERLLFVSSFSNAAAELRPAPFPGWPAEMLTRITFTEAADGTTVTVESASINANESERNTFDSNHASMRQGWGGTFDQLAAHLENA